MTVTRLASNKEEVAGGGRDITRLPPNTYNKSGKQDCHQFNWSPTHSTGPQTFIIKVVNKVTSDKVRAQTKRRAGETSPDCHGLLSCCQTLAPE